MSGHGFDSQWGNSLFIFPDGGIISNIIGQHGKISDHKREEGNEEVGVSGGGKDDANMRWWI